VPSKLRRLAQGTAAPADPAIERCDLCSAPVPPDHRHVLDVDSGRAQCACRACVILFDRPQAGGDHYKLIGERRVRLGALALEDQIWAMLGVPVDLAFAFHSTPAGQVVACYPSPLGVTRHVPAPDAWEQLVEANPVLADLESDVEALLVNRSRGAREHWIVPIDDCYRLVGRVRVHWTGFNGGDEVWSEIARFFAELRGDDDAGELAASGARGEEIG
jgi:uncharacterized protein DUF5947